MLSFIESKKSHLMRKSLSSFVAFAFVLSSVMPPSASAQTVLNLPIPGTVVPISSVYTPMIVNGLTIYPTDPFKFDFLIDTGNSDLKGEQFREEALKLTKYFLASLTIPEKELWVNLSPYEKNRIISKEFGLTDMGKELLAQDYMLKQLTASLMNPDEELGKRFWDKVYKQAKRLHGTTDIPVNTFNKIWIVPEKAVIYEHENSAFIMESHLKVMLEEDFLALKSTQDNTKLGMTRVTNNDVVSGETSQILKDVLLPVIEKEVNEGETFAQLRQIYHGIILASWYKQTLKESLLGQVFVDQNKTLGLEADDSQANQKIYEQYVEAYKIGVYDFIKEDYDPTTQQIVPRKYFSGGVDAAAITDVMERTDSSLVVELAKTYRANRRVTFSLDAAVLQDGGQEEILTMLTAMENVVNKPEIMLLSKLLKKRYFLRISPLKMEMDDVARRIFSGIAKRLNEEPGMNVVEKKKGYWVEITRGPRNHEEGLMSVTTLEDLAGYVIAQGVLDLIDPSFEPADLERLVGELKTKINSFRIKAFLGMNDDEVREGMAAMSQDQRLVAIGKMYNFLEERGKLNITEVIGKTEREIPHEEDGFLVPGPVRNGLIAWEWQEEGAELTPLEAADMVRVLYEVLSDFDDLGYEPRLKRLLIVPVEKNESRDIVLLRKILLDRLAVAFSEVKQNVDAAALDPDDQTDAAVLVQKWEITALKAAIGNIQFVEGSAEEDPKIVLWEGDILIEADGSEAIAERPVFNLTTDLQAKIATEFDLDATVIKRVFEEDRFIPTAQVPREAFRELVFHSKGRGQDIQTKTEYLTSKFSQIKDWLTRRLATAQFYEFYYLGGRDIFTVKVPGKIDTTSKVAIDLIVELINGEVDISGVSDERIFDLNEIKEAILYRFLRLVDERVSDKAELAEVELSDFYEANPGFEAKVVEAQKFLSETSADQFDSTAVKVNINDGIAVVTIDSKHLNALNDDLRIDLYRKLDSLDRDGLVQSIIITGTGRAFMAGAFNQTYMFSNTCTYRCSPKANFKSVYHSHFRGHNKDTTSTP